MGEVLDPLHGASSTETRLADSVVTPEFMLELALAVPVLLEVIWMVEPE